MFTRPHLQPDQNFGAQRSCSLIGQNVNAGKLSEVNKEQQTSRTQQWRDKYAAWSRPWASFIYLVAIFHSRQRYSLKMKRLENMYWCTGVAEGAYQDVRRRRLALTLLNCDMLIGRKYFLRSIRYARGLQHSLTLHLFSTDVNNEGKRWVFCSNVVWWLVFTCTVQLATGAGLFQKGATLFSSCDVITTNEAYGTVPQFVWKRTETTPSRRSRFACFGAAPECDCCVHTWPNEAHQEGERCRVPFNPTKQGRCEYALRQGAVLWTW